jgi:Domain of unknown function (DUF6697)
LGTLSAWPSKLMVRCDIWPQLNLVITQDGYIFVGLGNEKDAFKSEETHELFIQFAPKKMFYAGRYSFHKVEDLTVEEWQSLLIKASLMFPCSQ